MAMRPWRTLDAWPGLMSALSWVLGPDLCHREAISFFLESIVYLDFESRTSATWGFKCSRLFSTSVIVSQKLLLIGIHCDDSPLGSALNCRATQVDFSCL